MTFNNALSTTTSSRDKKSTQKVKGNGKIRTFSLSDIFHRQPAQGSATRSASNSFNTGPTMNKVLPSAKSWAKSSSLSIPPPAIPGFPALDGLKREECGVNENISLTAGIDPSSNLSTHSTQDTPGMKPRQTLPSEPPPIPPPPSSKKAPSGTTKGKKASKDEGFIADFIPSYARGLNNAGPGDIPDLTEAKKREHVHRGASDWNNEAWPPLDEVDPLPARLKPVLPSQPPSILPPPSKDKGKDTPKRKGKNKEASKPPVESSLPLPLPKDAYDYWPFEDNQEELVDQEPTPVPLHMRSTLPSGPPPIASPPTTSKGKAQGQKQKTKKGEKQRNLSPPSVVEYHGESKVKKCLEPPALSQRLSADLLIAEWDEGPASASPISLPPSLRQVLPKEPPPSPLPPSLRKKHKNKAEKQIHNKLASPTQHDLALFIPAYTANHIDDDLKSSSGYGPTQGSVSARRGSPRSGPLLSIDEEGLLHPVAVPQRLQPVLPTQPPSIAPPPSLKNRIPGAAKRPKKRSQSTLETNEALTTSISANLSETASSSSPLSLTLSPFSHSFEDDTEWPTPPSSACDVPARLRPVLPSGPPPIPEPRTPRTKQKSVSRRKSSTSHPLSPFIPAYADEIYTSPSEDLYELGDILDESTDLEYWLRGPRSPFSDEDTLVASPPSWPEIAPRPRVLPDHPPPIPPPPTSPLSPGKQSKRRRSSASSHPLASFIPAYAKEGEQEEPPDIVTSPSDGWSGYVHDQRDRLRKLRRDYFERTKELRELQEERQKTPKKSGKGGVVAAVHWQVRWEKAKQSIYNAARACVKGTRLVEFSGLIAFDFHGVMAEEAQYIVLEILEEEYANCEACGILFRPLKLVTGRGAHSANRVPKVKPAVEEALSDEGWRYEDYGGYFIVWGRVTDNTSPKTIGERSTQGDASDDLDDGAEVFALDFSRISG